jgi:hypothetical protein
MAEVRLGVLVTLQQHEGLAIVYHHDNHAVRGWDPDPADVQVEK